MLGQMLIGCKRGRSPEIGVRGTLKRRDHVQSRRRRRYDRHVAEDEPHVLVVAHRPAATPRLLEAVRRRAQAGGCRVTLLVPKAYWDPDPEEAELVVELAVPLLDAAGRRVEVVIGDSDPVERCASSPR